MSVFLFFSGVALLPFVDEKRLLACLAEVYSDLTEEESTTKFLLIHVGSKRSFHSIQPKALFRFQFFIDDEILSILV